MEMRPVTEMKCIPDLIIAQTEQTSDAIAITYGERSITYFDLNQRSNQLASRLKRLGVGPGMCVAVSLEPSIESVVALLGIWKSGGTYLPLDQSLPSEWCKSIITS